MADRKDWKKIKTEYITGNISYRDLAKKYDVHFRTISNKARAEGWVELKRKKADETVTETIDAIKQKQIDRGARLASVAEKLMAKVEHSRTRLLLHRRSNASSLRGRYPSGSNVYIL